MNSEPLWNSFARRDRQSCCIVLRMFKYTCTEQKRKQSFERFALFECVNDGQKNVYAAAKSNVKQTSRTWPKVVYLLETHK